MVEAEIIRILIDIVNTYGLIGIFLANLISNASVIFPLPGFFFVAVAGAFMNPFLVGIFGALGAAIGELVGYYVGKGGRKLSKKKWMKKFKDMEVKFKKYRGFFVIILFSATPLPHDIVGLFCGLINYDVRKFFIATFIGRAIIYTIIAYSASIGFNFALEYFEPI